MRPEGASFPSLKMGRFPFGESRNIMRMVIYVEVDSEKQRDRVWERLENMVETDELSGFFTLTVDGLPCVQDAHRGDLDRLAEAVADAELAEDSREGGSK